MQLLILPIVILLSGAGFAVAFYIWLKKHQQVEFSCPLNGKCHNVVNSDYSKFFHLPLEQWGMLYYSYLFWSYVFYAINYESLMPEILWVPAILSALAVLFSVYLTLLQLLKLKEMCTWCIVSAGVSTIIGILTIPAFLNELAALIA